VNKNATHLGFGSFIGSNTTLIAPVTVGSYAVVAAGSVLQASLDEKRLFIGRSRGVAIEHALCDTLYTRYASRRDDSGK
jgi:bifunctional UDP-N-acetylglucosamine pyrophosphorylase/glucosamine-1-phosphate N-acetyltransferase